jgi:hypothetical protein
MDERRCAPLSGQAVALAERGSRPLSSDGERAVLELLPEACRGRSLRDLLHGPGQPLAHRRPTAGGRRPARQRNSVGVAIPACPHARVAFNSPTGPITADPNDDEGLRLIGAGFEGVVIGASLDMLIGAAQYARRAELDRMIGSDEKRSPWQMAHGDQPRAIEPADTADAPDVCAIAPELVPRAGAHGARRRRCGSVPATSTETGD